MNVSILFVQAELLARFLLDTVSNSLDTSGKSLKDTLDISSLLHGDNSELILLIDPDQESLGVIVEDTTTAGPVSVEVASLEESVTLPKIVSNLFESIIILKKIEKKFDVTYCNPKHLNLSGKRF